MAVLPVQLVSVSMSYLGLAVTQQLMFLFNCAGGPAAMGQRLGEAYRGVLAAHGG